MLHLLDFELLTLHDECLRRYGGMQGSTNEEAVFALIERVRNHAWYEGIDDVFLLAALYCEAIARGHVFIDGNKRTAINAAYFFLDLNGIDMTVPDRLDDIVIETAVGRMTRYELAEILRAHAFSDMTSAARTVGGGSGSTV